MNRREAWEEARRLVVQERHTYAQAADATGLSVSTLQKRAAQERWQDQRRTASSYSDQVRALKVAALEQALRDPGDPQKLYAWQQLEKAWPEHRYAQEDEDPKVRLRIALEILEELVSFLGEVSPTALEALRPHLRPFGEKLEERYAA